MRRLRSLLSKCDLTNPLGVHRGSALRLDRHISHCLLWLAAKYGLAQSTLKCNLNVRQLLGCKRQKGFVREIIKCEHNQTRENRGQAGDRQHRGFSFVHIAGPETRLTTLAVESLQQTGVCKGSWRNIAISPTTDRNRRSECNRRISPIGSGSARFPQLTDGGLAENLMLPELRLPHSFRLPKGNRGRISRHRAFRNMLEQSNEISD